MSQAKKTLNKIASSEEYKALVAAIEQGDYETIFNSYVQISGLLEESEREIEEKIRGLPRRNRDEDRVKFQSAFTIRAQTTLPQWHWLDSELKKQGITEGEVIGFGGKGDPLARTKEGRVVVIRGAELKEGEKARFQVVAEGEKVDFGRVFEFSPDFFYFMLSRETRERVRNSLSSIREYLDNQPVGVDEDGLTQLSEILKEIEGVRELAPQLREEERDRIIGRVVAYRGRLLRDSGVKMAFEFFSREEERAIGEACQGDEKKKASALSAPGLFRYQAYQALKAELFAGEELKEYGEIVDKMEKALDSMNSALELMDFQAGIKGAHPSAKRYFEKMDRLFERLSRRARQVALAVAEDRICDKQDILSAIEQAFSFEALCSELRRVFRSPDEFFALRGALLELRAKLGDADGISAEAALKPYLRCVTALAFENRH